MESNGCRISVMDKCRIGTKHINSTNDHGCAATDFNMRFVNRTSRAIWLKTRQGVNSLFPPMKRGSGYHEECFEIMLEWRMPSEMFRRTVDDFERRYPQRDTFLTQVLYAFDDRHPKNQPHSNQTSMAVSLELTWEMIDKLGGVIYLEELDITLCVDLHENTGIEHPHSPTERERQAFMGVVPHISKETFVFSLKAVENGKVRRKSDRYMALGDKVYVIPIERDRNLRDGVHLVCRNSADDIYSGDVVKSMVHTHMSFDEADLILGLRTTAEEAAMIGDKESMQKRQLADALHQQKMDELAKKTEQAEKDLQAVLAKEAAAKARTQEELRKEHARNLGDWIRLITTTVSTMAAAALFLTRLKPT